MLSTAFLMVSLLAAKSWPGYSACAVGIGDVHEGGRHKIPIGVAVQILPEEHGEPKGGTVAGDSQRPAQPATGVNNYLRHPGIPKGTAVRGCHGYAPCISL